MPVVSVGQKLPSIYLDRFQPVEGLTYRISVLDTRAIATEFHFVDIPSRGVKGSYQCIQGACCTAFGRRSQMYNVPIFVYQNPLQSTEGEVQTWRLSAAQWKKFSDMAQTVDFTVYDIMLVAQKRGYGLDLSYSAVPDVKLREYWSAEQKEQLSQAASSFYQLGEASLVDPMSYNDWNQLLWDCGFDLQNMAWPGGQSPMTSGGARRSIGVGVVAPQLPMAPSMGVLPPVPGMAPFPQQQGLAVPQLSPQGAVGSFGHPILQPQPVVPSQVPVFAPTIAHPPQFGTPAQTGQPLVSVPPSVSMPAPASAPPPVSFIGGVTEASGGPPPPVSFIGATQAGPGSAGVLPVEHTSGYIAQLPQGQGDLQVDTNSTPYKAQGVANGPASGVPLGVGPASGVPLGTAPVIPQTKAVPPETPQLVPAGQGMNVIPGQQEISMEEMDQLLS